jgi:hypothetical protein
MDHGDTAQPAPAGQPSSYPPPPPPAPQPPGSAPQAPAPQPPYQAPGAPYPAGGPQPYAAGAPQPVSAPGVPQPYPVGAPQPPYGMPYPPPAPPQPSNKKLGLIIGIIAAVLVLVCGGGTAAVVALSSAAERDTAAESVTDEPTADPEPTEEPTEEPTSEPLPDIFSRSGDPKPLTVSEVFPSTVISGTNRSYRVVRTDVVLRCSAGATGLTATALTTGGCSQIVRATVVDSTTKYRATFGIANLRDTVGALGVVRSLQDANKGSFEVLRAPGTKASNFRLSAGAFVGSRSRGHYVVFCVVGLTSGDSPSRSDANLRPIVTDLSDALHDVIDHRVYGN